MNYEKPKMEIEVLEMNDIVCMSGENEGDTTGGWN